MFKRYPDFKRELSASSVSLAVIACLLTGPGATYAQERDQPKAVKVVDQVPPKSPVQLPPEPSIDVATGSSCVLSFDPIVEGVDVADLTVCNVRQIRKGVIVQGLRFGKTRVTLWGEDFGIKTFDVIVQPDRKQVMARLQQKYPRSGLHFIASPETGKLIIEITVAYSWALEDVYQQLEGPGLSRSQMVTCQNYYR